MKKFLIAASIIAVAAMLVFSFSGCASIAQKAIEKAAGASVNLSSGEVNVTDSSGNEVNIGGNKVPDNWPSSVPVNDKITIQISGSSKSDNKTTWTISGTYNGKAEDLYNWYKSQLSGWTSDYDSVTSSGNDKIYTLGFSNDKYTVSVMVTDSADSGVGAILGVAEK
jgi:ABC-type Fe3+-hydroxamate transport system substrate-binding protein